MKHAQCYAITFEETSEALLFWQEKKKVWAWELKKFQNETRVNLQQNEQSSWRYCITKMMIHTFLNYECNKTYFPIHLMVHIEIFIYKTQLKL